MLRISGNNTVFDAGNLPLAVALSEFKGFASECVYRPLHRRRSRYCESICRKTPFYRRIDRCGGFIEKVVELKSSERI